MKTIWRILKGIFFSVLGLALTIIILLALDNDARAVSMNDEDKNGLIASKEFSLDKNNPQFDALLKEYGRHKSLAKGFELQCLLALSHYPELKEVPIDFQIRPTDIPLASRPAPLSVLLPWVKRKYLVIISDKPNSRFEPILLKNTPFNAQVGIIGHELAHTVYYQDKNSFQLANIAYKYANNRPFHKDFERKTDMRAVAHGLGHQLIAFAYYARKSFGMTDEEIDTDEGGTYLSPNELLSEMAKYPFYK